MSSSGCAPQILFFPPLASVMFSEIMLPAVHTVPTFVKQLHKSAEIWSRYRRADPRSFYPNQKDMIVTSVFHRHHNDSNDRDKPLPHLEWDKIKGLYWINVRLFFPNKVWQHDTHDSRHGNIPVCMLLNIWGEKTVTCTRSVMMSDVMTSDVMGWVQLFPSHPGSTYTPSGK